MSSHPGIAVSVIVAAFNPGHLLKLALGSVYSQTYKASEVIVVDDGFTESFRQPHRGSASARSAEIMNSTGELLAFVDADDLWFPSKLAHQVALMAANPQNVTMFCLRRVYR